MVDTIFFWFFITCGGALTALAVSGLLLCVKEPPRDRFYPISFTIGLLIGIGFVTFALVAV